MCLRYWKRGHGPVISSVWEEIPIIVSSQAWPRSLEEWAGQGSALSQPTGTTSSRGASSSSCLFLQSKGVIGRSRLLSHRSLGTNWG